MQAKEFRWLFLGVIALIIIVGNIADSITFGITAEWTSEGYRIAGGTSVGALAISLIIITLYVLLLFAPSHPSDSPMPGLCRRWLSFWMDFVLSVVAVCPIAGLIPMLAEWSRTGEFAWNFARTTPQTSDKVVIAITMLLIFTGVVAFYAIPLTKHHPSPGSCITGYQVVSTGRAPLTLVRAILRSLLGFVAVATGYIAPFIGRNRKGGQFWLDKVFETRAVKLN